MPKLPVVTTILLAYANVFRNMGALLRAWLLPGLALVLIETVKSSVSPGTLASILFWLVELPFVALLSVACHRIVLLGAESLTNPWSLYWTSRETSFMVWLFFLTVFAYISVLLLGLLSLMAPESVLGFRTPWLGKVLTVVSVLYFYGRFSMVLPATAIGKNMFLSNSWYLSTGNGIRITIVLLVPLAVHVALNTLCTALLAGENESVLASVLVVIDLFSIAVGIAVLSMIYRWFRESLNDTSTI